MANKKNILGKVVATSLGYNVRIIVVDKYVEKKVAGKLTKVSYKGDTGKFGVYAGKNLRKGDFSSKAEALDYCIELYKS